MRQQVAAHMQIIDAMKEIASKDPRCVALILGGSFGRGDVDRYSDIDFWLAVNDNRALESLLADMPSLMGTVGNPIFSVTQSDLPGFGVCMYRVVFDNMVLCDIHLNTISSLRPCPSRNRNYVLIDKTGLYVQNTQRQPEIDTRISIEEEFEHILGWFVFDSSLVFRRLMKGELWSAIFYLNRCRVLLFKLLRLYVGSESIFRERPDREIEKDIPFHLRKGLEKSLPDYSTQSISQAFEFTVSCFLRLAHELAEREDLISDLTRAGTVTQILEYWCDYLTTDRSF